MTTPASLGEALAHVTRRLSVIGIAKLRENTTQSFMFRGIDDIHNVLSPILVEAGLCITPQYSDRVCEERQTAKGNKIYFVTVVGQYTIRHLATGESIVVGPIYGEAMDSADKASNKAMSAAYKYFAIQTFCIPVEGQPDADATATEELTDHQQEKLESLREAALSGMGALETAWQAAGREMRLALAGHLPNLKEAASKVPQ